MVSRESRSARHSINSSHEEFNRILNQNSVLTTAQETRSISSRLELHNENTERTQFKIKVIEPESTLRSERLKIEKIRTEIPKDSNDSLAKKVEDVRQSQTSIFDEEIDKDNYDKFLYNWKKISEVKFGDIPTNYNQFCNQEYKMYGNINTNTAKDTESF